MLIKMCSTAGSAILFYMAKKRQWDVRQSLRRASRRLTGRSAADLPKTKGTTYRSQNRRPGVRIASPPPSAKNFLPKGRGERDVEKGLAPVAEKPRTTTTITSQFEVESPKGKGWKGYFGAAN
jgi:hypothetical protein